MLAYRLLAPQKPAQVEEVPKPTPKAGEVLVKVGAAGACHSDLHLMDWPAEAFSGMGLPPFTLGHECSGWIAEMGAGGGYGLKEGDPVIAYGAWGCGYCRNCRLSAETHCENASKLGYLGGGLGRDGSMAEYVLVPSARLLFPAGKLDPRTAAPLTDAALTPYHAIKRGLPLLVPGSTAVVIGVGGLGHMAVQILKAVSAAFVVACDVAKDKLELAKEVGADEVLTSDTKVADRIKELTGGLGAEVVLDFVGSDATLKLGAQVSRALGQMTVVGLAGGHIPFGFGALPFDTTATVPYWGTSVELMEVMSLAEQGKIAVHTERFPLRQAPEVYAQLRQGKINGRAVLNP